MGLDQIDTNKWMVNINSDEDLRVHGLHQIGGSKSIWLLIQRSERGMDNEVVGSSKIWTLTFQFQILPMPVAQFGSKSKSSWYSRSNMAIYGYIYYIYIIYIYTWQYYAIICNINRLLCRCLTSPTSGCLWDVSEIQGFCWFIMFHLALFTCGSSAMLRFSSGIESGTVWHHLEDDLRQLVSMSKRWYLRTDLFRYSWVRDLISTIWSTCM